MVKQFEMELAGKKLTIKTGLISELASGSAIVTYGETVIFVSACSSKDPRDGIDFFPLSCEYQEKLYSVGKIPGGFLKREGRPTDKAVLTSRLIDRPIRPLFPKGYRNDVQVVATAVSVDQECSPEIVAMIASSVALSISDIPFDGPTGSVLVGYIDGEYVINPDASQREKSEMHLVVSGTKDAIMMVEAGATILSEEIILKGILKAHEEIKKIVNFIDEIAKEVGKQKKDVIVYEANSEIKEKVETFAKDKINEAIRTKDKEERANNIDKVYDDTLEHLVDYVDEFKKDILDSLDSIKKEIVRNMILDEKVRPDDRSLEEIRPISTMIGLLPRTHGSGLFTRGQTQVISIATLGALGESQSLDGLDTSEESKRYMHHYNFPPYSVGEARPMRGPGRREVGHGALAERALEPVLPSEEDFPYAIRVVSEVLSSNGSSSQASVCGSSLSLMDAGVPIKDAVAGIAMGLIKSEEKVAVLSDIQGMEDFLGDMDFKVAGTKDGITAIQMDIKIKGIDEEILKTALEQARIGRLHILSKMNETISETSKELSKYAPRVVSMRVHPDKIRDVIGQGGKTINKIIDETGVKIDIDDTGLVLITAPDLESGKSAKELIEYVTKDAEVGEVYTGKIVKILPGGAFVQILPGKEGYLRIGNVAKERIDKIEDLFREGDEIKVKVTNIDKQGKIDLSRKVLL